MPLTRQATEFVRSHGHRAPQLLVDQMVAATRAGDEAQLRTINALARAVDLVRTK